MGDSCLFPTERALLLPYQFLLIGSTNVRPPSYLSDCYLTEDSSSTLGVRISYHLEAYILQGYLFPFLMASVSSASVPVWWNNPWTSYLVCRYSCPGHFRRQGQSCSTAGWHGLLWAARVLILASCLWHCLSAQQLAEIWSEEIIKMFTFKWNAKEDIKSKSK